MFRDSFLRKSTRTKRLYAVAVSLHRALSRYRLSFLVPICRVKLLELDAMLLSTAKWFHRFQRYHRSPQVTKWRQQINALKGNVDAVLQSVERHCSVVLYALIRGEQLLFRFHHNAQLLVFWMLLFPADELEFERLSWAHFVANVRCNASFVELFGAFTAEEMVAVLTANYEVLSIDEFLHYVLEYESVGGWLLDMHSYIAEEIAHPHKQLTAGHSQERATRRRTDRGGDAKFSDTLYARSALSAALGAALCILPALSCLLVLLWSEGVVRSVQSTVTRMATHSLKLPRTLTLAVTRMETEPW